MRNLFSYGTLMCDDIMAEVSGIKPSGTPCLLRGYRRLCVKGEHYPALVPDDGYMVDGIIYQGLSGPAWHRLDIFEGAMYSRERVMVELESGQRLGAMTYVLKPDHRHILDQRDWDFVDFVKHHKGSFQSGYKGYRSI